MYHYIYATQGELKPVKKELERIIHLVQDEVRDDFTFSYEYVGSSSKKRNLVTYDPKSNIGFDFDVNIHVNDEDEEYEPEEIRSILFNALRKNALGFGYNSFENSTSVITIKFVEKPFSRIHHSCDFAIVYNGKDGQQYIRYNKKQDYFSWEFRSKGFENLEERADWLKKQKHWNEVRDLYLYLKNTNTNSDKHSRSIYAEAINNLYNQYSKNGHE